ncbi:hypothetical protein BGZ65_006602, partial [Modicella reniformis]
TAPEELSLSIEFMANNMGTESKEASPILPMENDSSGRSSDSENHTLQENVSDSDNRVLKHGRDDSDTTEESRSCRRKLSACEDSVDDLEDTWTSGRVVESAEEIRPSSIKRKRSNELFSVPLSPKESLNWPDACGMLSSSGMMCEDSQEPLDHSTCGPIPAKSQASVLLNRLSPSAQQSPLTIITTTTTTTATTTTTTTATTTRTDIVFVKAGMDVRELSPKSEQEANKMQEAMRLRSELAIGSRCSTEEVQLTKRKWEDDADMGTLGGGGRAESRRKTSDGGTNDLPTILLSPTIPTGSVAQDNIVVAPLGP